jgi:hypothetical protein
VIFFSFFASPEIDSDVETKSPQKQDNRKIRDLMDISGRVALMET